MANVTLSGVVKRYGQVEAFLHIRLSSGQVVVVKAGGRTNAKVGDSMRVAIERANAHYFDAAGQRLPLFDKA